MKNLGLIILTVLINGCFSFFLFRNYGVQEQLAVQETAPVQFVNYKSGMINQKPDAVASYPSDFVAASKKVAPAVVNIRAMQGSAYRASGGSGVIISDDGYIITNHHVIEGATEIDVTLHNKREMSARLVGSDPTTDLALLKINAKGLTAIPFGDSDAVEVGEWVLAVGNPFNLASTITAGIVSAKGRNINILQREYAIESFIQTDAVVNPGNSGGALVGTDGRLVGINTAIISETGGYEGYSFAIPSNLVYKVVHDLKETGSVQRAILGVRIADVNDELAKEAGLNSVEGVYITEVNSGSSAQDAGLRSGDVILSVNGIRTSSVPELQEQVALFRPGDNINIEFVRKGKKYRKQNVILNGLYTRHSGRSSLR